MLGKFAEDRKLEEIESMPENRMGRLNELYKKKKKKLDCLDQDEA